MSLNRITTRMAIISALTNFGREPWPTVANGLIFDSKIEANEQLDTDEDYQKPIAVVYTDYDKDFMVFRNKLQSPRHMTVTIELLVVQAPEEVHDEEGQPTGMWTLPSPVTDSELEMTLDLFELSVFAAMQGDNPAGAFFNAAVQRVENVISRRGAAVSGGQRLAARQTTIEVDLLRDPMPGKVPPYTRAFLEACMHEPKSDYRDRAAVMLSFYEATHGSDVVDFQRRAQGLPKAVSEGLLGTVQKPYAKLPLISQIKWVDPERQG